MGGEPFAVLSPGFMGLHGTEGRSPLGEIGQRRKRIGVEQLSCMLDLLLNVGISDRVHVAGPHCA